MPSSLAKTTSSKLSDNARPPFFTVLLPPRTTHNLVHHLRRHLRPKPPILYQTFQGSIHHNPSTPPPGSSAPPCSSPPPCPALGKARLTCKTLDRVRVDPFFQTTLRLARTRFPPTPPLRYPKCHPRARGRVRKRQSDRLRPLRAVRAQDAVPENASRSIDRRASQIPCPARRSVSALAVPSVRISRRSGCDAAMKWQQMEWRLAGTKPSPRRALRRDGVRSCPRLAECISASNRAHTFISGCGSWRLYAKISTTTLCILTFADKFDRCEEEAEGW